MRCIYTSFKRRMNTNTNKKRKRQQEPRRCKEKLQQYGIELPDIPNVHVEIIPLLVHCLKASTQFFQHYSVSCEGNVPYNDDWNDDEGSGNNTNNNNVNNGTNTSITATSTTTTTTLDIVLNRIETAEATAAGISSATAGTHSEQEKQKQRQIKMKDALQTWLQAVKRAVKNDQWKQQQQQQHQQQRATGLSRNGDGNAEEHYNSSSTNPYYWQQQQQYYNSNKKSQPISCFDYLWNILFHHKRVAVRRSSLYMIRHLVTKSSDCRSYFLSSSSAAAAASLHHGNNDHQSQRSQNNTNLLWDYLQLLCGNYDNNSATTNSTNSNYFSTFDPIHRQLWQKEGYLLLLHLIQSKQQYYEIYPKLIVAEQYLKQHCSSIIVSNNNNNSNNSNHSVVPSSSSITTTTTTLTTAVSNNNDMNHLRNLRDIAIKHGVEEIKRTKKLIQKCYQCMDIIFPRLIDVVKEEEIINNEKMKKKKVTSHSEKAIDVASTAISGDTFFGHDDDDTEEDDNIDWEDGWENETAEDDKNNSNKSKDDHAQAVERTLQAMESIGGLARKGGGLEIDFDNDKTRIDPIILEQQQRQTQSKSSIINSTQQQQQRQQHCVQVAKERFTKCARFLSERHLPRICAWLEGLNRADRLCQTTTTESSSSTKSARTGPLILISPQQGQQREEIRRRLEDIKTQVVSVSKSVSRLGMLPETSTNSR